MNSTKMKLDHPVTVDGQTYTEIALRRPKVRDQLAVSERSSPEEREVALIANLAEVSFAVVTELDLADYTKIQRLLTDFFTPPTSAAPASS